MYFAGMEKLPRNACAQFFLLFVHFWCKEKAELSEYTNKSLLLFALRAARTRRARTDKTTEIMRKIIIILFLWLRHIHTFIYINGNEHKSHKHTHKRKIKRVGKETTEKCLVVVCVCEWAKYPPFSFSSYFMFNSTYIIFLQLLLLLCLYVYSTCTSSHSHKHTHAWFLLLRLTAFAFRFIQKCTWNSIFIYLHDFIFSLFSAKVYYSRIFSFSLSMFFFAFENM